MHGGSGWFPGSWHALACHGGSCTPVCPSRLRGRPRALMPKPPPDPWGRSGRTDPCLQAMRGEIAAGMTAECGCEAGPPPRPVACRHRRGDPPRRRPPYQSRRPSPGTRSQARAEWVGPLRTGPCAGAARGRALGMRPARNPAWAPPGAAPCADRRSLPPRSLYRGPCHRGAWRAGGRGRPRRGPGRADRGKRPRRPPCRPLAWQSCGRA